MHELEFYSYHNRLRRWPWSEKCALGLTGLVLVHRLEQPLAQLGLSLFFSVVVWRVASIPLSAWLRFLAFSVSFILFGSLLTLLASNAPSQANWSRAGLLFTRSLAGLSVVGFLVWTTPAAEWCSHLRSLGIPRNLADIAMTMVAMIGVTSSSLRKLRTTSLCRCGDRNFRIEIGNLSLVLAAFQSRLAAQASRWELSLQLRGGMGGLSVPVKAGPFHSWLWLALSLVWGLMVCI